MNSSYVRTFISAGALGLSIIYASQASAITFFVDNNGGFLEGSENPAVIDFLNTTTNPPAPANTFEDIFWVAGTGTQSRLNLETKGSSIAVDANAGPVIISKLTHTNAVIPAGTTWSIETSANFALRGPDDATVIIPTFTSNTAITFLETANDGTCNDLFLGVKSNNLSGSNCDDLYGTLKEDFLADDQPFEIDGEEYLLSFGLLPGAGTEFETITNPDDGMDYFRVYAAEGDASVFNVTVEVTAVPEPGPLALMSIGLIGFGIRASRKVRKNS